MPFVRYSRDRRGYEHIYLVHTPVRRGKAGRPRVLYWYRTPPGVKVGREAFDETIRQALEAQHPDVEFDWDALAAPPPPPPVVEPWRERRRLQKARKARADADPEDVESHVNFASEPDLAVTESFNEAEAAANDDESAPEVGLTTESAGDGGDELKGNVPSSGRRRRRGGRGRRETGSPPTLPTPDGESPGPADDESVS